MSLVVVACGDDDDEPDTAAGDTSTEEGGEAADGGEVSLDEEVEVAEGTVLPLPDCPSDWDPEEGLTDTSIKLAMSLPESGPVAALGGLDDGMRAWFAGMEPIDGRTFQLVSADAAYDPACTLSNTEEFLATEQPFAFTDMIGTPNNLAIRDLLHDECVPQLFNSTGFPAPSPSSARPPPTEARPPGRASPLRPRCLPRSAPTSRLSRPWRADPPPS
jgi:hypothetical protein